LTTERQAAFFIPLHLIFFVENNRSNSEEPADFFYSINQNTLLTRLDLQSAEKIDSQIEKMAEKNPPPCRFVSQLPRVFCALLQ
jgi:hypothetical protein